MATHSSVLAWRIPGTGEPGGLPSMGSHRVGHDCGDLAAVAVGIHYVLINQPPPTALLTLKILQNLSELQSRLVNDFLSICFVSCSRASFIHLVSIHCKLPMCQAKFHKAH